MSDYKTMFEQAVRALASIDEALGLGDDGCGDLDQTLTRIKELTAQAIPADHLPTVEHIRELTEEAVQQVMEQAQAFASGWALVGGRFDSGKALEDAEDAKDELRRMVRALADLAAQTVRPAPAAPVAAPEGFALVPLRMTKAMQDVTEQEDWTWEDLLASAEAITEEQYGDIDAAPAAPVAVPLDEAAIRADERERCAKICEGMNPGDGPHEYAWAIRTEWADDFVPAPLIARSLDEWDEGNGPVSWWAWNGHGWAGEPAWIGTPNDDDWPGYHTHWTPHPGMPAAPSKEGGK